MGMITKAQRHLKKMRALAAQTNKTRDRGTDKKRAGNKSTISTQPSLKSKERVTDIEEPPFESKLVLLSREYVQKNLCTGCCNVFLNKDYRRHDLYCKTKRPDVRMSRKQMKEYFMRQYDFRTFRYFHDTENDNVLYLNVL